MRCAAADHGNATASDQFRDPVTPHSFNECFDLIFTARDFDHQFLGADIDDLAAENLDQFPDLTPLAPRGALTLSSIRSRSR